MAKVLITGASGGFGNRTVRSLVKSGHTVVASMRDIRGKNRNLADEFLGLGATVVEMDVTQESSVTTGASQAIEAAWGYAPGRTKLPAWLRTGAGCEPGTEPTECR